MYEEKVISFTFKDKRGMNPVEFGLQYSNEIVKKFINVDLSHIITRDKEEAVEVNEEEESKGRKISFMASEGVEENEE